MTQIKTLPLNNYLIDAYMTWIIDNGWTPYIVVDGKHSKLQHLKDFKNENDQITFNISVDAVRDFHLDKDGLSFSGSFNGVVQEIYLPLDSIMFVFASENGIGFPLPIIDVVNEEIEDMSKDEDKPNNGLHLV